MDILVCMKQVIDDSVPLDPAGLESASTILNPYDGYALELALRYVQKHEGSVTVLSAGGAGIEPVLYQGMACGADQAVRIGCDDNSGDFSQAIWAGICELEQKRGKPYDLVLVGKEAPDTMSGGTGPKLAHLLERGFLSLVTGFDEHTAKRQTDEGSQKYRWLSPFVFSVERFGNDLRYPTLKNKLAARKKERERIEGEAGAQDSSCKKEYIAFSKRKGCIPVQPEQIQDAVQTIREIIEEKNRGEK